MVVPASEMFPTACTVAAASVAFALWTSLSTVEQRPLSLELAWAAALAAALVLVAIWVYTRCCEAVPKGQPPVRCLVVGCGAVGSVVGYHLARGGAQIGFLVRDEKQEAARGGLRLERYGTCTCSSGQDAVTKTCEWVGFDVFTHPNECAGAVELRHDKEPAPFDVVILALSAAASRAAVPMLKQLLRELDPKCLVVRVVAELGEDEFFHSTLGVHHSRLVDLGVSFLSHASPLVRPSHAASSRRETQPCQTSTFSYLVPSAVLFSDSEVKPKQHNVVDRMVKIMNETGLSACRVPSVSRHLALPSAILTTFVAALEISGWSFSELLAGTKQVPSVNGGADEALSTMCAAAKEALGVVASRHPSARLMRCVPAMLCPRVVKMLVALAKLLVPFDLELYLCAHFTKVAAQTRIFLAAYIEVGENAALPVDALKQLLAGLPKKSGRRVIRVGKAAAYQGEAPTATSSANSGSAAQQQRSHDEVLAMSAGELKALLCANGVSTAGCLEKADLVAAMVDSGLVTAP